MFTNKNRFIALLCSSALFFSAAAHAEFPEEQPLNLVSPYAAGGANDALTRMMAKGFHDVLGITTYVENRAGANGQVGAGFVAKSKADGYTLLMGNSATHGTNPKLYPDSNYDPIKDFTSVGMVGAVPVVLAVSSELGVDSVQELIALAEERPGELFFGSSGVGGTGHLTGETFKKVTGIEITHAPYKGDAPATTDAMSGQVSMAFVGAASVMPHLDTGRLKVLAIAHPNRVESMPDVPTMKEAGVDDVVFSQWYALVAPAGVDAERITILNDAAKNILEQEEVKEMVSSFGAEVIYMTPTELDDFIESEVKRFGEIIEELDLEDN